MMRYAYQTSEGSAIADDFKQFIQIPSREAFAKGNNDEGIAILTGGIVGQKPTDIPAHILQRRKENMNAARSLALSSDEFPLLEADKLKALGMPIALLTGANTAPIHAAIFKGVSSIISQAECHTIANSGHAVSQQQPDTFNTTVLSFIERTLHSK